MEQGKLGLFILAIIVLLGAIGGGFFVGWLSGNEAGRVKGVVEGVEMQKKEFLAKVSQIYNIPEEPQEIFSYHGKIKSLGNSNFVLEVRLSAPSPFHDEKVFTKNVQVDANTRLEKQTFKDTAIYEKEKADAIKKKLPPPMPYLMTSITFNELQEGQIISVASKENIKDIDSFTASTVLVSF